MKARNVGDAILLHLKRLGVDWFFANPGSEFASIIQGFADLPEDSVPKPILAPHEFQAVSMAYGCFLATGRPQAVMTHANVGAANALIGLIACARMNIPLLFISGQNARTESNSPGHRDKLIHWAQDSRDPGAAFREYVKWEVELTDPLSVYDVLDRAWAIATTEPYGPVAIKVARDILVAEQDFGDPRLPPGVGSAALDRHAARPLFAWLAEAQRPLIITNRAGAEPGCVAQLAAAAEKHGLAVLTPEDYYLSFSSNHPQHLGFRVGRAVAEADLVVVLNSDAPWYPIERGPHPDAKVVHVGPDPLFAALPLRSHRGDLFLCSAIQDFLTTLIAQPADPELVAARLDWIQSRRAAPVLAEPDRLTTLSVSAVLGEFLTEDVYLVNELSLVPELLNCRHPGRYFRSGSASPLGWGVGCALGLSLAAKSRTVIAAIGDGSFYLSPVLGSLLVAAQNKLNVLFLILDNQGLASVATAVAGFYQRPLSDFPLTSLASDHARLERCADIVSGRGFRVHSPHELKTALTQGLEFCRNERRPAVINAVLYKERSAYAQ